MAIEIKAVTLVAIAASLLFKAGEEQQDAQVGSEQE